MKENGVYLITHKDTDIKYVGSTFTKQGFCNRWRAHLSAIRRNVGNTVLCRIATKYGIEGFQFHILEVTYDYNTTRERERYWIKYYNSFHKGANLTEDTFQPHRDHRKNPYTEEEKLKLKLNSTTKKTVYVYDLEGNLIHTFISSVDCDRFFNIRKGRTSDIINSSKLFTIKNKYVPSYQLMSEDWNPKEIIKKRRTEGANKTATIRKKNNSYCSLDAEYRNKIRLGHKDKKMVSLYTLEGEFIKTFSSLNECDDYLNLTRGSTSKVLKGKAKTLKKRYIPKLI